tara:strand:- start:266 stop:442 length:177 start_codon:yes stop_codon:yes gene_type:complete
LETDILIHQEYLEEDLQGVYYPNLLERKFLNFLNHHQIHQNFLALLFLDRVLHHLHQQ